MNCEIASSGFAASTTTWFGSASKAGRCVYSFVSCRASIVYCTLRSSFFPFTDEQSLRQLQSAGGILARRGATMSEEAEVKKAEERTSPSGAIVYQAICKEGSDELERSTSALAWSGLAAGLSMGFSLVGLGLLRAHLPDAEWRPVVVNFGYSLGFLIVVLGRQQLFTENTLTVILPLLNRRDGATLRNVARLWTTVLLANLAGALLFAAVIAKTEVFDPATNEAFMRLGQESLRSGFAVTLLRGIFAGWLIALMVWLLPFAESARVWVIVIV